MRYKEGKMVQVIYRVSRFDDGTFLTSKISGKIEEINDRFVVVDCESFGKMLIAHEHVPWQMVLIN